MATKHLAVVNHPVLDAVDASNVHVEPIIQGVSNRRVEVVTPAGNPTSTTMSWSFQPPAGTLMDRQILLKYQFTITSVGTQVSTSSAPVDATLGIEAMDSLVLREFPLSKLVRTVNLTINGTTVTHECSDLSVAQIRMLHTDKVLADTTVGHPNMLDQRADVTRTHRPTADFSNKDLIADGLTNGNLRNFLTGTNPTYGQQGKYTFEITEPLNHPLLARGVHDALANINQVDITLTLNNVTSMLRRGFTDATLTTLSTQNFIAAPIQIGTTNTAVQITPAAGTDPLNSQLLVTYYTVNTPPPAQFHVHYHQPTHFTKPLNKTAKSADALGEFSTDAFRLSQVPEFIMIYVTAQRDKLAAADGTGTVLSNMMIPIENISMTINNQASILQDAQIRDLYSMSRSNGLVDSFPTFQESSLVVLRVEKDLCLNNPLIVPGASEIFNTQMKIKVGKQLYEGAAENDALTLHMVYLNCATAVLSENFMSTTSGYSMSELSAVMAEGVSSDVSFTALDKSGYSSIQGGGFFSAAGKVFGKAKSGVGILNKYVPGAVNVLKSVAPESTHKYLDMGVQGIQKAHDLMGSGDTVIAGGGKRMRHF